jgi:tetratricopeptide (TPR) repeat protein
LNLEVKTVIKKIFYILLFILGISLSTYAQNQSLADSLINYLDAQPTLSDSSKFVILKSISINSTSPSQVIFYANKAKVFAEKEGSHLKLAAINTILGAAYKAQGKMVLALENFLSAEQYYKIIENVIGQASVYAEIASLYSIQDDYKNAHLFMDKAIIIFKDQNDTIRLASLLQNKGNTFRKVKETDSAMVYFNQSLELFRHKKAELYIAYNLGNIGLALGLKGDFNQAELMFNEALEILEKYGDSYAIADFCSQMASIYFNNGRIQVLIMAEYRRLFLLPKKV